MSATSSPFDTEYVLNAEKVALAQIKDFLCQGYEARVKALRYGNVQTLAKTAASSENREFWKSSVYLFEDYFSEIDRRYKKLYIPRATRKKKRDTHRDMFETDLQRFKSAFYDLEASVLLNSRHHKRCKKLFQELVAEVKLAELTSNQPNILGRVHFKHIEMMLDIEDDEICKILPFLLTSYVYNFRKNRFMSRGTTSVAGAFSIDEIETGKTSDIKNRLKLLSTYFGLKDKQVSFSDCKETSARPMLYPDPASPHYPSLKDKSLLDLVFATWCTIVAGFATEEKRSLYDKVRAKVDFQLSYALYLYYTDAQQYKKYEEEGFPSKKEILLGMAASYEQDSDYKMESIIPETWLNLQD